MPRRRAFGSRSARHRSGPVEWVGGRVTLPVYITEGEPYRPEAVVWLELPSELVRGFSVIDPARGRPSFSDTLREAMRSPLAGPPSIPARVRVADQTLAAEVRSALGPVSAEVIVAPTPELDELVHQLARSLPEGDEPESYLEDGRVSAATVERLFRVAQALYHVAPWTFASDGQVVRLDVAERRVAGAAVSIIGALGESLGFLVFPSLAAFETFAERGERLMRRRRAPATIDLGSGYMAVTFDHAVNVPRSMRDEVLEHAWPIAGPDAYPRIEVRERDGIARPVHEDDVRLATAVAGALTAFASKHEELFGGGSLEPVSESYTGDTGLTVRLTAPYEAFDLFDAEVDGAPRPERAAGRGIGRNEPCPCGSGKKYKRCHLGTEADTRASSEATAPARTAALHQLDRRLADTMAAYARQRFAAEWLRVERDFTDVRAAEQLSPHWALYHLRLHGGRVVDHFMAERDDRLTREEREWLNAQSRSWLGIWEVEDAEPGASLDLHDILTGERRHVTEASGSRMLVRRSAVLARVVDQGGVSLICGTHPQPLPPIDAAAVARLFRDRLRRGATAPAERLREERLGRDLIARWEEAAAALEERSRIPPRLQNRDGDELVFISERYDFDPPAREEVQRRLATMDAVVPPEDEAEDRDYIFHREGPAARPGLEDLIVGHVGVDERSLSLETNSLRRANALRSRVETALGDLIRHRRRRRRDAQRMVARMWEREPSRHGAAAASGARGRDELAETPEAQQALRKMKERHYADWPDQSLPALGGQTARQAIRTKIGRERVDVLLKDIEFREASLPAGERFDASVLRRTLGL